MLFPLQPYGVRSRLHGFFEASDKLLQLAKANDEAGVKAQFGNVGKACGGCHETYRAKPAQ